MPQTERIALTKNWLGRKGPTVLRDIDTGRKRKM